MTTTAAQAAVLVAITDRPEPGVILTVRREDMRTHAGQVAFPGGRIDPQDEDAAAAALREAGRSSASTPRWSRMCGERRPLPHRHRLRASRRSSGVVPPDLPLAPHEHEVADWFEAPLGLRPRSRQPAAHDRRVFAGRTAPLLPDRLERPQHLGRDRGDARQPVAAARMEGWTRGQMARPPGHEAAAEGARRSRQARPRFVGGAVRDALLGLPVSDLDLATRIQPDEVVARLEAARIKAVPTGIAHGTVTAVSRRAAWSKSPPCAPTSPPTAAAPPSPSPTIGRRTPRAATSPSTRSTPTRSAARFSIISAASTISRRGRVRFIGEPLERIAEDHLRILRFFRFHARFGKGEPDPGRARRLHRARQRPDGAVARADRRRTAETARHCPIPRRPSR